MPRVFTFGAAMMKIKLLLACLTGIFVVNGLQAQDWCGTMQAVQSQIRNHPELAAQYQQLLDTMQQMEYSQHGRATNTVYPVVYVPVVFHIISNGDALGTGENITDAQAASQIEAMNLAYSAQDPQVGNVPAAFQPNVANCYVQFCLAKFDPSGNPTTGIIRHTFSQSSWDSTNEIDDVLKPATIWDHTKYLNVWSVRMGGDLVQQGILAYSSFPFFGAANADGVVARYNTIGTTGSLLSGYNLGKTVTHEAGHWLGLRHTWGDDGGKCHGDQGAGSDNISDTPDQGDANYGCPTFPHVSCNNGPNGDMFMNYMDYTDDVCRNMFTWGQADRMHTSITAFRTAIPNSASQCFYNLDVAVKDIKLPKDTICSFNFKPVITIRNEGLTAVTSGKFYFQLDGDVVQTLNWTGNLAPLTDLDVTLPLQTIYAGGVHTFNVSFSNPNGQGADSYNGNDDMSIFFNAYDGGAGTAVPFSEGFESTFPTTNWSVSNPNNDLTWVQNTGYGAYGSSSSCASINNSGYAANPNKKKDAIVTDAYDLSSVTYPELKFDVAYARRDSSRYDSLNVYYSLNCGSDWTRVWSQSGSTLATAPDQSVLFTPATNQWKTVTLALPTVTGGQNKVSIKFENVSGWGNALYLDNINLQNDPALAVNDIQRADVKVFPNPASGLVAVRMPFNNPFTKLQLMNSMGQVVYETTLTDNAAIFSVSGFENGLYFIHLTGTAISQTERLLIVR